jgi:cytidine diphosphoramidate kinase
MAGSTSPAVPVSPSPATEPGTVREGPVIWIIGLSGAGKSTVAGELVHRLSAEGVRPVVLDGDELRAALGATDAFDLESRHRLAFVYGRLCRLLARQGHTVVCAAIGLYHRLHDWNRDHLAHYFEVLLDVPLEELERRDPKGLYGDAADGQEVMGVGLDPEFPAAPDLVVRNWGPTSARSSAERIFDFCTARGAW